MKNADSNFKLSFQQNYQILKSEESFYFSFRNLTYTYPIAKQTNKIKY